MKQRIPQRGDVYWVDPNPVAGREMRNRHRFLVITPKEINALGVVMMVPITTTGIFHRLNGLTVPIQGHDTTGTVICNHVRSFDIQARVTAGTAKYVETISPDIVHEVIMRVLSVIDPADE